MAQGRTRRDIARLRNTFDALDRDGDGLVSLMEMKDWMDRSDLSQAQKSTILAETNTRLPDEALDFAEFKALTLRKTPEAEWTSRVLYRVASLVSPRHHFVRAEDRTDAPGDYVRSYSCCPPPVFILLITLVEIGVFLYYTLSAGATPGWFKGCGGCFVDGKVGPLIFYPPLRQEAWRFISYMLVHSGLEHLLGNVLVQVLLGTPLELVHKIWRVGPVYLAGVLLGSLLQYSLDGSVILVGASGGVYALITAHLANVILNWREMPFRWGRLIVAAAFVVLDVGHVLYRRLYMEQCDRISYTAHIGGAAAGFLLGLALLRNLDPNRWEKILAWVALALFVVFLATTIVLTLVFSPAHVIWSTSCEQ